MKRMLSLLFPPRCVICDELLENDHSIFCERCEMIYLAATHAPCIACGQKLPRCNCSTEKLRDFHVKKLFKLFRYVREERNEAEHSTNHIIHLMKEKRDVLCRDFLAQELAASIRHSLPDAFENPDYVLTFAPRSRSRKLEYGFDQSQYLGKRIAKLLSIRCSATLIRRKNTGVQKKKEREARFENMKDAYCVKRNLSLHGKRVLLVDDVTTTGASLGNAAKQLYNAGAKEVIGVTIAVCE
ncbi:MAG: ComF family protein [Clostridia bacterium]|nr:ComF family protein [Clostridia bacterium]